MPGPGYVMWQHRQQEEQWKHPGRWKQRCIPCLVEWTGPMGEPCWMCGKEGEMGALAPMYGPSVTGPSVEFPEDWEPGERWF